LIIVTGQSGVSIKNCLKRLGLNYISVDDVITKISGRSFEQFIGDIQILQYSYWKKSFETIAKKELRNYNILTFHACYNHQHKNELFSSVDIELLFRHLKNKVKAVIVFIDDIFNVYLRLLQKGKMYSDVLEDEVSPLKAIYLSIYNIISLLNWREMEISISRVIAKVLNSDFFIVSTNHPVTMIKRLFEKPIDQLKIYYLSHPITEVREKSSTYLSKFVGELGILIENFIKNENNILFIPTAIDELIIKREDQIYLPELVQRWSEYFENELVRPPLPYDVENINPLNPKNHKLSDSEKLSISILLELLKDRIYLNQIISRDYSLVEQSKNGIIAIRPYFNGVYSSGMNGEINHNKILMNLQDQRRLYVYSCKEDFNKYAIKRTLQYFFPLDSKEFKSNYEKLISKKIDIEEIINNNKKQMFIDIFLDVLPKGFDFTKYSSTTAWEGGYLKRKEKAKNEIFNRIFNDLQDHPIKDQLKKDRTKYLTFPENNFINEVIKIFLNFDGE
ncbi:MAG: hypothetical protein ACTSQP_24780, partial [Promethearchaeota archaeon]